MGELVNLNRARKLKARADAAAEAEQNRLVHGRTKAEKTTSKAEREKAERRLEGHRREPEPE